MCDGFANFYRDVQETTLKPPWLSHCRYLSIWSGHLVQVGDGCIVRQRAELNKDLSFFQKPAHSAQPQPNHGVIADYGQGDLQEGETVSCTAICNDVELLCLNLFSKLSSQQNKRQVH